MTIRLKKALSLALSAAMCVSLWSTAVMPASAEEEILLAEDFSSYSANELLNTGSSGNSWSVFASNNQAKWLISVNTRGDKTGSAGSSALLNDGIMTLNYNNLGGNVRYYNPYVTRKVDTSVSGVGSAMALPSDGILVVSARIKVDANTTSDDFSSTATIFGIAGDDALSKGQAAVGIHADTNLYHSLKLDSEGNVIPANFSIDSGEGFKFPRDTWHTYAFTYDLSQTTTNYKCNIFVTADGSDSPIRFENISVDSQAGPLDSIYGITMGLGVNNAKNKDGNGTIYYDDFEVRLLPSDAFKAPEFTTQKGTFGARTDITMSFAENFEYDNKAELISAIASELVLKDTEGNEVDITCTPDGDKAVITLNEDLIYNSKYTFSCGSIPGFFYKLYIPFTGFESSFTTIPGRSVYIDKDTVSLSCGDDITSAESITVSADVANPEAETASYTVAAAAYTSLGKLAGLKLGSVEFAGEASKPVTVEDIIVSDAAYMTLYIWAQDADTGALGELMQAPVFINPAEVVIPAVKPDGSDLTLKTTDAINSIFTASGKDAAVIGNNNYVTLILLEDDVELADADETNIKALWGTVMSSDGSFAAQLGADIDMGDYKLWAFNAERTLEPFSFSYVSPAEVEGFLDDINDGTVAKADIYSKTMQYNTGIGVDDRIFATEKAQNLFNYRLDKKRSEITGANLEEKLSAFLLAVDVAEAELDFVNEVESAIWQNIPPLLKENAELMGTTADVIGDVPSEAAQAFVGEKFANADEIKTFLDKQLEEDDDEEEPTTTVGKPKNNNGGGSSFKPSTTVVTPVVPVAYDAGYSDMADYEWAKEAVNELTRRKIVAGMGDSTFAPADNVTREQFVKMLVIAAQSYNSEAACNFDDVREDSWYYSYVASAKEAGLVNGVSETEFGTGRPITREDMAVMIYNALKAANVSAELTFADADSVSDYAKEAVAYLAEGGYVTGKDGNLFAPGDLSTRAEAAVIIHRFLTK